mmetsp:Transcript_66285/g.175579  ORF Transcript_66285/g.175579 Transcript_66285/m.175579 type:complete len:92 (-) Transcript_66285:35-310(-)
MSIQDTFLTGLPLSGEVSRCLSRANNDVAQRPPGVSHQSKHTTEHAINDRMYIDDLTAGAEIVFDRYLILVESGQMQTKNNSRNTPVLNYK